MQYVFVLFVRDQASENGLKTLRIEQYASVIYTRPREREREESLRMRGLLLLLLFLARSPRG